MPKKATHGREKGRKAQRAKSKSKSKNKSRSKDESEREKVVLSKWPRGSGQGDPSGCETSQQSNPCNNHTTLGLPHPWDFSRHQ
jgi:hypothetical protein